MMEQHYSSSIFLLKSFLIQRMYEMKSLESRSEEMEVFGFLVGTQITGQLCLQDGSLAASCSVTQKQQQPLACTRLGKKRKEKKQISPSLGPLQQGKKRTIWLQMKFAQLLNQSQSELAKILQKATALCKFSLCVSDGMQTHLFPFNLCVTICLQTRAACLYTQLHTLSLNKTEPCVYNSPAARAAALVCRLIVTWWNYTTDVSAQSWKKQIEQQTQQTPSGLFKVGGRFPVGEKRK